MVEDLPAEVHIIARRRVDRIEPPEILEDLLPERHVATWHVFGAVVGDQDVHGSARGPGHHMRADYVSFRREIGSSHASHLRTVEAEREIVRPLHTWISVTIEIGNHIAVGLADPFVASRPEAGMGHGYHARPRVPPSDRRRRVGRAVIDDNDLELRIVEDTRVPEALVDGVLRVVRADDDADGRPRKIEVPNSPAVPVADDAQGGLRRTVRTGQPEVPTANGSAADRPFVGPREHAGTGHAALGCSLHLPREHFRLPVVTGRSRSRIDPDLSKDQWTITREVLQLREVATEVLLTLEVHVECQKIERRQWQIFRRRVVAIRHQHRRIYLTDHLGEFPDRLGHEVGAQPAKDISRNLVAERQGQDLLVPCKTARGSLNLTLGLSCDAPMLPARHADEVTPVREKDVGEDPQPGVRRHIEKVVRRERVRPHHREARGLHGFQVELDLVAVGVEGPVLPGGEGAIGDPPEVEPICAPSEEFAVNRDASVVVRLTHRHRSPLP